MKNKITMPLFDFDCWESFTFHNNYKIERLSNTDIPMNCPLFSKQDVQYMRQEEWAIIADRTESDNYIDDINLLLIAFRIYSVAVPFIKYRVCKENHSLARRLCDKYETVFRKKELPCLAVEDLEKVNKGFKELLEMYNVGSRAKNALYFAFRGFSQIKWMDAYAFFSFALEALFSREDKSEPTKTIINRVSRILNCSKTKINDLYEIRSDIVHGRIEYTEKEDEDKKKENLKYLQDVEDVVIECLRKFLDEKIYLKSYVSKLA